MRTFKCYRSSGLQYSRLLTQPVLRAKARFSVFAGIRMDSDSLEESEDHLGNGDSFDTNDPERGFEMLKVWSKGYAVCRRA